MRDIPKWLGALEHRRRDTQEDLDTPGKEGCRRN
jgi:hypothetical protein